MNKHPPTNQKSPTPPQKNPNQNKPQNNIRMQQCAAFNYGMCYQLVILTIDPFFNRWKYKDNKININHGLEIFGIQESSSNFHFL